VTDKAAGDARYRPFRAAAWISYVGVVTVFGLVVTAGVTKSVWKMTPGRPPAAAVPLPAAECIEKERALWTELDEHRKGMSEAKVTHLVDTEWTRFRIDWVTRQRQAEAACAIDEPGREELKAIFGRLNKLMDLYTTHAVQFAGEIGPTLDALKQSLGQGPPPAAMDGSAR
jgi:hypothetical protein